MEHHTLVSFNESRFTNGDWVGRWGVLGYTGSLGPHRRSHYLKSRESIRQLVKWGLGPGAAYLTGKLWSGLILSSKLYSCERNVCKLG